MKVYIEKLFLDNMVANFIILYFSSCWLRVPKKISRIILASAIAALAACFVFTIGGVLKGIVFRIFVSLLMCFTAFYRKNDLAVFAKGVFYTYAVTLVFNGAMLTVLTLSGDDYSLSGGVITGQGWVFKALYALGAATIVLAIVKRNGKRDKLNFSLTKTLEIFIGEKCLKVSGFIDTGNTAKEPITSLPAIILNVEKVKDYISKELYDAVNDETVYSDALLAASEKIRMVPYSVINGQSGILLSICPKKIYLIEKGKKKEVKAVLALTPNKGKKDELAIINAEII